MPSMKWVRQCYKKTISCTWAKEQVNQTGDNETGIELKNSLGPGRMY